MIACFAYRFTGWLFHKAIAYYSMAFVQGGYASVQTELLLVLLFQTAFEKLLNECKVN